MSADMPYFIANLKRSASHAAWDMTVNTSLVRKLIAGTEVAEAQLAYDEVLWGADDPDDACALRYQAALDAYKVARVAK